MKCSKYLCALVGVHPHQTDRLHPSTLNRITAFGIAIHLPVLLWAGTGYTIASSVFGLTTLRATMAAVVSALVIYLVERLVLATPKTWYVSIGRIVLGAIISTLGATSVDIVIFEKEISQQLTVQAERRANIAFAQQQAAQKAIVQSKRQEWLAAQAAAQCEANGTCGSKMRSTGPIYRELARHADRLRSEYEHSEIALENLRIERDRAIARARESDGDIANAGLLTRVEALHEYTSSNRGARIAWALFFTLILCIELTVVLSKLVFGETVDDQIDRIREQVSEKRARAYLGAVTSPVAGARELLSQTYY